MKGEGENAPEHERLLNVTGNAEFLRTVECARKRTGNPAVFAAISDVAARRARETACIACRRALFAAPARVPYFASGQR